MKLTDTKCRNSKPESKSYKISDGDGLFLLIHKNGSKYWRYRYYFLKKEKLLALGVYPTVSLSEARKKRDEAKRLISEGKDPVQQKKSDQARIITEHEDSFQALAKEWLDKKSHRITESTVKKIQSCLDRDVFPHIGSEPISNIEPPDVLSMLRIMESRGAFYQAGRVRQYCSQIFKYAIACGKCKRDPSADIAGALTTAPVKHYASIPPSEIPEFLKALDANHARLFGQTRRAIELLMLTAVRTNELIYASWSEFDFNKKQWEIPAERMKMRRPHIVPLSDRVIELLKEQQKDTAHLGHTPYVFVNQVRPKKPMSNNTVLSGIKRLGFKGVMTGHGFRSLFMTTMMEELKYSYDIVDLQLAHAKESGTRRAYDRTKFLDERRIMMQDWADYISRARAANYQ